MSGSAQVDFAHVAAFASIVDSGGFTAAARRLGTSKATISRQIKLLEARFGARLLIRTTRSVRLTDDGARFYGHCRAILAELAVAEDELVYNRKEPAGSLRVEVSPILGSQRLASLLRCFLDRHPGLQIDLTLCDERPSPDSIGSDVVIRVERKPEYVNQATTSAPLVLVVCGAPQYLERNGRPATPRDLAHHTCLRFADSDGDTWRLDGPSGRVAVKVAGRFQTNYSTILHGAALSGLGLALLPRFQIEEDKRLGALVEVLPGYEDRSFHVYATYSSSALASPMVRAFANFLNAAWRDDQAWDDDRLLGASLAIPLQT